ncbi:MAG TPA: hypothetical protein VFM05_05945, partial [Candidatus Saccharimonadales bacterium]|nr:hypothetical protein [Candidatus Saccharimonadales bacterium]
MENKNPFQNGANSAVPIQGVGIHEPPGPDALSQDLERSGVVIKELPAHRSRWLQTDIILVLLLIVGTILSFYMITRSQKQNFSSSSSLSQFETTRLPLNDLKIDTTAWSDSGPKSVIINGDLQVSESFVLLPSLQPTGARPGELYYDKGTNQLAYFNGTNFVFLTGPSATPGGVQSLGGATGRLLLGAGVDISRERLENTGVLSVQGQAGDVTLTAGPGIIINGTSFGNSGVISVTAGSPNVTVTNDDGNVTLSVTSGAGTITSSGGTIGTVPLFTAAQNIENSIISQSGLAVTISGDLNVVTGGLTLSNALTVSNGGTGTASLGINGVLVGNGTAAISSVAAGGSGLCLVSTAGAPAWSACPGATGVSSLNGLTGALTIANSSAAGSTITLDNASTTTKGIASFNATNFTASSGLIDTSQDINASATPTFSGVNTNTITPSATLTVGSTGQQLILQGNASTQLTATGGGFTTAIGFAGTPTGALTYNFDRAATSGTYTICTSIGNCASAAGGVTTLGGTTNAIALFTGSQTI